MTSQKKIQNALISVYYKDKLEPVIQGLAKLGVKIFSTGGTQEFIEGLGVSVTPVEELTAYPSILGGRVKTLHPKIFGGILGRREESNDLLQMAEYEIPEIDLVIVDLYPFEETLASGAAESAVIEKIDIGGISLIRAAAKNYKDVLIVPSKDHYDSLLVIITQQNGESSIEQRKAMAAEAFNVSSHYDTAIYNYFSPVSNNLKISVASGNSLRYGENPHQNGLFHGDLNAMFDQLNGKALSYNNLLDLDAGVQLIDEFEEPTFAILKHNNACGIASRSSLIDAWKDALQADPVSAFGGVLIANREVDAEVASGANEIFFELIIAPSFTDEAIRILSEKKNRIILKRKKVKLAHNQVRTLLNGFISQDKDLKTEHTADLKCVSKIGANKDQIEDMLFANKVCKHTRSNAIVIVKNKQMLASGVGQTSRVDALRQAIAKAVAFNFDLKGSVMASDAFFPFPDCVEISAEAGIKAIIQPGGSIKDQDSIDASDKLGVIMVMTGTRHFKH